jgi:hypothetical protein
MGSQLSQAAPACCGADANSKLNESSPDSVLLNTSFHAKHWYHPTQIPDLDCKFQEQLTDDQNIWDVVHGLDRSLKDLCEAATSAYHVQHPHEPRIPFFVTDCFNHLEFLLAEFSNPSSSAPRDDRRVNVKLSLILQAQKVYQSAKLTIDYRESMRDHAEDASAYWKGAQRDLKFFREKYQISKSSSEGVRLWKVVRGNVNKALETQRMVELVIEKASRVIVTMKRVLSLDSLKEIAPEDVGNRTQISRKNSRRASRKAIIVSREN